MMMQAGVSVCCRSDLDRLARMTETETSLTAANDLAIRRALEDAGVEFIDENGGGPGVRLRKSPREKPAAKPG
jgi:hypothetical protein